MRRPLMTAFPTPVGTARARLIFPRLPIPQLNMVFSTSRHPRPEEIYELGRVAQLESWPCHILVRTEDREPNRHDPLVVL